MIVGEYATTRSYMTGPMAGMWAVWIGKAQLGPPPSCTFNVTVTMRSTATLPAQTTRAPYVASKPLSMERRYYAGDFHVHCVESGDALPSATVDEIAGLAASVGLDFVHFSDHNTVSASTFLVDAQSRHPKTLLLPGVEWTTYSGHAGAIGTTVYVDHKVWSIMRGDSRDAAS
jgi:hypothetical protein